MSLFNQGILNPLLEVNRTDLELQETITTKFDHEFWTCPCCCSPLDATLFQRLSARYRGMLKLYTAPHSPVSFAAVFRSVV